jgi:hypothetical protein
MPKLVSQKAWDQILQRQLDNLSLCKGVTITRQGFVQGKNPHRIYHDPTGTGDWKYGEGYQQIEFTLECNAIMDCDPKKLGNGLAYPLKLSEIKVQSKHKLVCLFPRSFPHDPIGWGLYFEELTPQYPNLMSLDVDETGLVWSRFSRNPGAITRDGVICIGAASTGSVAMHELVDNLRSYMLMEDPVLFKNIANGGNNDGGFDTGLLAHFSMNFTIMKNALENHTGRNTGQKRKKLGSKRIKLGGNRPKRRKLGS